MWRRSSASVQPAHARGSTLRDRGLGGPNPRVQLTVIRVLGGHRPDERVGVADRSIGWIHRSWDMGRGAARSMCLGSHCGGRACSEGSRVHPQSVEQWPSRRPVVCARVRSDVRARGCGGDRDHGASLGGAWRQPRARVRGRDVGFPRPASSAAARTAISPAGTWCRTRGGGRSRSGRAGWGSGAGLPRKRSPEYGCCGAAARISQRSWMRSRRRCWSPRRSAGWDDFNQELFGGPTTLPWGLEIDPAHRPRRLSPVRHLPAHIPE